MSVTAKEQEVSGWKNHGQETSGMAKQAGEGRGRGEGGQSGLMDLTGFLLETDQRDKISRGIGHHRGGISAKLTQQDSC